ncbi:MAG: hypothetical protein RL095_509 [Verrucomicrobiota bacterium]|jgi:TPR repeat protein
MTDSQKSLVRALALPVLGCLLAFVPLLPVFGLDLQPGWRSLTGFLLFMLALLLVLCQSSLGGERERTGSLVLILSALAFSLFPALGAGASVQGVSYGVLGLCLIILMLRTLRRLRRLGWKRLRARLLDLDSPDPSHAPSVAAGAVERLNFRIQVPALNASAMMEEVMRLEQDDPLAHEERILALLRQAAERGLVEAQGLLAQKLKKRNLRDPELLKWVRVAASQGDAMSCCLLAEMLLDGQLLKQDIPQAMKLYEQAIEIDEEVLLPEPLKRLGDHHLEGRWMPRDFAKARRCYRLAAAKGSREAAFRLGLMQLRDFELAASPGAAAESFRQALDHPAGVYPLDRLAPDLVFHHGELQLPLKIAEELALAGGAGAARSLSLSYTHGLWAPADATLAASWMQMSRDLK